MKVLVFAALSIVAVTGVPSSRVIGGSSVYVESHPSIASLQTWDWFTNMFWQACGGIILNNRAILTAAHCLDGDNVDLWRIRIGSSFANTYGQAHLIDRHIAHTSYSSRTLENNIAILHSVTTFTFNDRASPASIAGPNYHIADNQNVWAVGWGQIYGCSEPRSMSTTHERRIGSEALRQVAQVIINQETCRSNYAARDIAITDNMLCSGWHTNGRGHCDKDSGSPLYHNGVVVGIFTFSVGIAQANFPSVHTRVSSYTSWITSNA
ncbi:trypsin, alkaline B-like [Spodoptera frugiperda]|uniref:Trypsin, alkaline B-like n=1 Tax=Spodoptera frugiperda TaxID=7108 RepID=A0A9R0DXD9_SPOFR|nr:trypsin, alkaline B-like [Spodoptera frugiperda]